MAPRLSLVLCLGAVVAAVSPAAGYSEPRRTPREGILLPDCRPQVTALLDGQSSVKELLAGMQASLAAIEAHLGICPVGWLNAPGSCFLLLEEQLTADDALKACQQRSPRAKLACLDEEEHRELVHGLIDDSPFEQAWIGLRRQGSGWLWSDGSRLEEGGPWLPYQPDNNGGEDCVMYDRTARYPGWTRGWSDERCVLTAVAVCEINYKEH